MGGDVEDLVRDLVQETNGDIELAQYGIIYIDEIDKIASGNNVVGIDVSRTGVQRGLLKPMEETEVDLKVPHDIVSQMEAMEHFRRTGKKEKRTVNTKNILFIVSGAFNGLSEIIRKRVNKQRIGFGAELKTNDDETDYLKMVTSEDLLHYGFESEFIGRLPVITVFDRLAINDLYQILKNRNSEVITGKKRDFKAYGIDLRFEDEALYKLSEKAFQQNTGARGLVSVIEKVLIKFEKKLPSTTIKRLLVTKEIVDHPEREITLLLESGESRDQRERYNRVVRKETLELKEYIKKQKSHFPDKFKPLLNGARINLIVERVVHTGIELGVVLEDMLVMSDAVRTYEKEFFEESGINIRFEEQAIDRLLEMALEKETPINELCHAVFKNYQQGLKLVQEKTGHNGYTITKEAIRNPEGFLNRLIKESYEN